MVFFKNGEVRNCDVHVFFEDKPQFSIILEREDLFRKVGVIVGGHGVRWDKLHPIKVEAKTKWFLKTEVLQRKWE